MANNNLDRRRFVGAGASIVAAALGTSSEPATANEIRAAELWQPHQADSPDPITSLNYIFFTPEEAGFVEAATERLIPADELGPGAKDCRVALFIDHQLAGAYGIGSSWYMRGPWAKGEKTQGFQSRMGPADMYRAAIKAIDAHVAETQDGMNFSGLPSDAQDSLLTDIENGKLALSGIDAVAFFTMLLMNTKEGMFSDPIYGGNKDMAGWKMIGFPGARYDYREWVSRHGQRYDLPPVGIQGRPDWTPRN